MKKANVQNSQIGLLRGEHDKKISTKTRHMHPKILKGLSSGLSFQFFEYLSFECEFKYLANFEKYNLK